LGKFSSFDMTYVDED